MSWMMVVAAVPIMSNCAIKNEVQAAARGCDEFQSGGQAVATLDIDVNVKTFARHRRSSSSC
jgi:hypothetical protein